MSGMDINKTNMMYLCTEMQYAKLLLSIHLNDNGINMDQSMFADALEIFKIEPNDLPP